MKFKDIFELLFRYSTFRTEQLNSAKKLLEDSDNTDSKEMAMVKKMMKIRAIKLSTNLINEKHGNLFCYLYSKCTEEEIYGLHKTLPFINSKDNKFYFNKNALFKTRLVGYSVITMLILVNIVMIAILKQSVDINLNWLFYSLTILEIIFLFYLNLKIMPDGIEIKNTKNLLEKTKIDEYNNYFKAHAGTINDMRTEKK
jgi:hypothetical protein